MSAFKTNKDEIKQLILSLGLDLDTETWDADDRRILAREIRKRTKPMLIAANKMDTPEAQANWDAITSDPAYDHLTFVPASAHAEGALKTAADNGVVDYTPGDDNFEIVGDPSTEQQAGLEQIRAFMTDYGGTGVQQAIETALFDVLGCIAVFPGSANGSADEKGVFRDCFVLPDNATTEDFAYVLHSDIGDGLLHGIDCRTERQVGADHPLTHRDVVEIVSTN
jgi:ribosome-binding ATPase YchF (GTP1/OBG family)